MDSGSGGRGEKGGAGGPEGAFHRIGVVGRLHHPDLTPVLTQLDSFASERGIELLYEERLRALVPEGSPLLDPDAEEEMDLLITLGGDGTLLRGARMVAGRAVPILGINLGHLGFLTSIAEEEVEESLDRIVAGEHHLDRRFTLEAEIVGEDGNQEGRFLALNDFVVHQAGVARMARLDLFVGEGDDEEEIGSFAGDGVVLATPTGSTAYSLSAGGPIVVPTVECVVVAPICPHTLALRPMVIPSDQRVTVRGLEGTQPLVLTVDGQVGKELAPGDSVQVRRGAVEVSLVRLPGRSFFSTLRRKLNWAAVHGRGA